MKGCPCGPDPQVAVATKPWEGTCYCPHLSRSLCSLVLPRDPRTKANTSGRVGDLSQTVATFCRTLPLRALPGTSPFGSHIPLSPQPKWVSPLVWAGNRHQRAAYKQRQDQNQSRAPGVVWLKKRKGIHSCSSRYSGLNPPPTISFKKGLPRWVRR